MNEWASIPGAPDESSMVQELQSLLGGGMEQWKTRVKKTSELGAGCMRGFNNPFPAPGADDVHGDSASDLPRT